MATFAQNPTVQAPGGFGTTHDYTYSCTAGNTLVVMTQDDTPDFTGVTLLGASGTLTLDASPGGGAYRVYSYKNLPSGVTGYRITTTGNHTDPAVVNFEGTGQLDYDASGVMPGDFTDIVSVDVTTTASDDLLVARWGSASGVFTPDSGYAASSIVDSFIAEYNSSALGAAATETISGTFDASAGGRGGFAVAYKSAGGGGAQNVLAWIRG